MDWTFFRDTFITFMRTLLMKFVTRLAAYGFAFVALKTAVEAPPEETQTRVVEYTVAVLLAVIALGLDYLHQRADRPKADSEQPQP
jgi:hypothetical protein